MKFLPLSPIVAFDDVAVDVGLHRVTGAHSGLLVNMSAHWWDEMLDGFVVANEWGSEGLLANNFGIRPDGNMVLHNQHYAQTPAFFNQHRPTRTDGDVKL